MKWFQHDTNASTNAKLKKVIFKHGAVGYAVYWHCLELISSDLTLSNINFELEHDSEIIADNLKIKGDNNEGGIDKVNRILRTLIDLKLLTEDNNRVFCFKLANRLDNTVSRSPEVNKIKALLVENGQLRNNNVEGTKKLGAEENRIEENKREEKRREKKKTKENKSIFGENKNVFLTKNEFSKLADQFDNYIDRINDLSYYIASKGDKYKDHYRTILNWARNEKKTKINTAMVSNKQQKIIDHVDEVEALRLREQNEQG